MDRGMCSVHTSFLLNGPTAAGMRFFGASVHAVIGDLKDLTQNDLVDLTDIYLYGRSDERHKACMGTYFYPNAMAIPGPSHLSDWIFYAVLVRFLCMNMRQGMGS